MARMPSLSEHHRSIAYMMKMWLAYLTSSSSLQPAAHSTPQLLEQLLHGLLQALSSQHYSLGISVWSGWHCLEQGPRATLPAHHIKT